MTARHTALFARLRKSNITPSDPVEVIKQVLGKEGIPPQQIHTLPLREIVSELEKKMAQPTPDLDFLRGALCQVGVDSRKADGIARFAVGAVEKAMDEKVAVLIAALGRKGISASQLEQLPIQEAARAVEKRVFRDSQPFHHLLGNLLWSGSNTEAYGAAQAAVAAAEEKIRQNLMGRG